MPNDGHRIYTEVRGGVKYGIDVQSDIYKVLGLSGNNGYDVVYACCNEHGKTNKWSAAKPVRYNKIAELTDTEMEQTDPANGIYYGLRMARERSSLKNAHELTFEYLAPRPNVDWSRVSDFDGYNHRAKPIPSAALPDYVSTVDANHVFFDIYIEADGDNMGGIDLRKAASFDLANMYPCVLISDVSRSTNYVKALENVEKLTYTTLKHDDAWGGYFGTAFHDTTGAVRTFLYADEDRLITLFFIDAIRDPNMNYDLRNWTEVTNIINLQRMLACPNAVAQVVPFYAKDTYPDISFSVSNVVLSTSGELSYNWKATGRFGLNDMYTYDLIVNGNNQVAEISQKRILYSGYEGEGREIIKTSLIPDTTKVYTYRMIMYRNGVRLDKEDAGEVEFKYS